MSNFSDIFYAYIMTSIPHSIVEESLPPQLPPDHPCYGCGNYGVRPCVGPCTNRMLHCLNERSPESHETGDC